MTPPTEPLPRGVGGCFRHFGELGGAYVTVSQPPPLSQDWAVLFLRMSHWGPGVTVLELQIGTVSFIQLWGSGKRDGGFLLQPISSFGFW